MGRVMPVLTVLVGLGFAAGFGSIAVDSVFDYRAFPAAPTSVTVARLAAMKSFPRGTWVRVVDAVPDCKRGYAKPSDTSYALLGDGKTSAVVIAALHSISPCDHLSPAQLVGVPAHYVTVAGEPGNELPVGLVWPDVDFQRWPEHRATILWTWSGPQNSRTGIWLGGAFALFGVGLVWYGIRWLRPRLGNMVVVDPDQFPSTVQLSKRGTGTLPATVVWLPVLRAEAVKARGIATDVTIYYLQLPENVAPLEARKQRMKSAHTGPGTSGLIFRSAEREAVAAARPAGSEEFVLLRSDLAELELSKEGRAALRTRHLRSAP